MDPLAAYPTMPYSPKVRKNRFGAPRDNPRVIVDAVRHGGQLVYALAFGELVNAVRERLDTVPLAQTRTVAVGDFEFPVMLTPDADDGGYVVECPALPGCLSQGDTVTEALANIAEAAGGWLKANAEQEAAGHVTRASHRCRGLRVRPAEVDERPCPRLPRWQHGHADRAPQAGEPRR